MPSDSLDPSAHVAHLPPDTGADEIRAALSEILASHSFASSERLRRFLAFVVNEALENRAEGLKEYSLGTEVCDRPSDFDPRTDPVVRVEARRLRARLAEYYAAEGANALLRIDVPKGRYVPAFSRHVTLPNASGGITPLAPDGQTLDTHLPQTTSPAEGFGSHRANANGLDRPSRSRWLRLTVPALLLLAAAGLAIYWSARQSTPAPAGVAVLPFVNLSSAPENDHFCFGLMEDLTGALAEIHGLRVVARTSAEQFRGAHDLTEISTRLRVRYVVEGSVRRDGRQLRVSARLVDTIGGSPVWSQTFDRSLDDVFEVQSQLSGAIAGALARVVGTADQGRPARLRTAPNPEAYSAFLKGQFLFKTQPDDHAGAIEHLGRSIALAADYAPAHLELAAIRASQAQDSISPPVDLVAEARQHVDRALELDPRLADALALRAWLRFFSDWDWNGATQGFEAALAISPSSSVAHHRYALLLMTAGRFDSAIDHCRRAMDLDPLSYRLVNGCSVVELCARHYADAERLARESTTLAPKFWLAHIILGSSLAAQGRLEQAITAYRAALDASPDDPDAMSSLGRAMALAGRTDEARAILARLQAPDVAVRPSHYELAYLLAALGETDRAFAELEAALADHETELVYLAVDPLFDPLHRDPRFEATLRKIGVPH